MIEYATGSVPGRTHQDAARNNQDAVAVISRNNHLVAVVCDGCSGGHFSEVGSWLGSRLIAKCLDDWMCLEPFNVDDQSILRNVLEQTRKAVISKIWDLVESLGESKSRLIGEGFLFSIVGAIVQNNKIAIFSLGDGVYAIDGEIRQIGPFPKNAPPYLAYDITGKTPLCQADHDYFRIEEVRTDWQTALIGTDGVLELIDRKSDKIPGREEDVGKICQFWEKDEYFQNPDALRRRLWQINKTQIRLDRENGGLRREPGLLSDDTTLCVLRKMEEDNGDNPCWTKIEA